MPPLMSPPTRLASAASSSGGAITCRADDELGEPGCERSIRRSIRSANRRCRVVPASREMPSSPASPRTSSGRGCRPTPTRCPAGERVGSVVVICPTSRNGRPGSDRSPARSPSRDSSSRLAATWTVPARRAAASAHGIGARSAQSTLNVAELRWNRVAVAATSAGREVLDADHRTATGGWRRSRPARRRRARTTSPSAVTTPVGPPVRSTTTRSTAVSQRITTPPRVGSRPTRASVIRPAPPSGTGKPYCCPRPTSSQPNRALPAASGVRSACSAQAGEQQRGRLASELLLDEPPEWQEHAASARSRVPATLSGAPQPDRRADRGERGQQRAEQWVRDRAPAPVQIGGMRRRRRRGWPP